MLEISCLLTASAFDCFIFFLICFCFCLVFFSCACASGRNCVLFVCFLFFFSLCVRVCVLCAESTVDSGVAGLEIPELTG